MNRPRVAQLLRELADEIDVEEEAPRVRKARAPRLPSLPAVEGSCWLWTGRHDADGYGIVSWCGRDVATHRVAAALAIRPLPDLHVVLHACDNPGCCNPAHLSIGTIAENNADMAAKGRARNAPASFRGTRNPNAKLTDALVAELRGAWAAGEPIVKIARRTGLAVGTVHPMLHGKTWRHVTTERAS